MRLPQFTAKGNLPEGIYSATWVEVEKSLAFNEHRKKLLVRLREVCEILKLGGCRRIYIVGSFVSNKPFPRDFDLCWEDYGCDLVKLRNAELELFTFSEESFVQKNKYGGDILPASNIVGSSSQTFLEYFQKDRDRNPRGVVSIQL